MTCIICERGRANGGGRCQTCESKLAAERKAIADRREPRHFLTYHGHVVGLFANGKTRLTPRLLGRNPDRLPKGKTIDLNHYCTGFTRETIKAFKRCVLRLAHA